MSAPPTQPKTIIGWWVTAVVLTAAVIGTHLWVEHALAIAMSGGLMLVGLLAVLGATVAIVFAHLALTATMFRLIRRVGRLWMHGIAIVVVVIFTVLIYAVPGSILLSSSPNNEAGMRGLMVLSVVFSDVAMGLAQVIRLIAALIHDFAYSKGFRTKSEKAADAAAARNDAAQLGAARLLDTFVTTGEATVVNPPNVRLDQGERAFFDGPVFYQRYYSREVAYQHSTAIAVGPPAFVATALVANAVGNAAARQAAQRAANAQWREGRNCRVIATNHRFIIHTGERWLSFWHNGIFAYYLEPDAWSLVLEYPDCEPLRLGGLNSPLCSVIVSYSVEGVDGLRSNPSLASLRRRVGMQS